jgi:phenylacetate-CoA ligase
VFPSQIEELILRCAGLAPHYEIELTRPDRLDEIQILVEARIDMAPEAQPAQALLLATRLKAHVGISAQIRIVPSGSLARSAGKAQRVRDGR